MREGERKQVMYEKTIIYVKNEVGRIVDVSYEKGKYMLKMGQATHSTKKEFIQQEKAQSNV